MKAKDDQKLVAKKKISNLSQYGIYLAFVAMVALFSLINPKFLAMGNLLNVIRQVSFNAIIAMGMFMVILTGGIDLSVGSVVAIASVITATFVKIGNFNLPVFVAILMGLAVGAVCGFFNGFFVTKGKLAPFIVTMISMTMARGASQLYTEGRPISGLLESFTVIGTGYWLGIPIPIYILLGVTLLTYFILNWTKLGRHIYAVGGNASAAEASGISVNRTKMFVYIYSGCASALVAVVMAARLNSASPMMGDGYELDAIAATVIGGTSMDGGKGKVFNVLVGALIIGTISNGLDIMNVSSYWQQIVKGCIILAAVLTDRKD